MIETTHFKLRRFQRKISNREIKLALKHGDYIVRSDVYALEYNGLRVIISLDEKLITTYRLGKKKEVPIDSSFKLDYLVDFPFLDVLYKFSKSNDLMEFDKDREFEISYDEYMNLGK